MNQTLTERAHSMRLQADMSEGFWAEAVSRASYLVNKSPSTVVNFHISEEICQGELVEYSILWIFGCLTYSLVDSQKRMVDSKKRNKLESKSKRCCFIGFTKGIKVYMLWDPEKKSAFVSRDAVFDEESMLQEKSNTNDKMQAGASDSSANSQRKEFEFSDAPNKHVGSDEDFSDSDGDMQEATQEQ